MTETALTDALEDVEIPQEADQQTEEQEDKRESSYIDTLVGEGKKYASPDDLAKAYHHASLHIEELKSDLSEFRSGREAVTELLNEIRSSKDDVRTETPPVQSATVDTQIQTEDVAKIVNDQIAQREAAVQAGANVKRTMDELVKVYGSEAKVKVAVTKAVGSDEKVKDIIDELSRSNPDTTVKFITGIVPADREDGGNTPGVGAATGDTLPYEGKLTWAKCREIKKDNPRLYKSTAFRKQIEIAAAEAADNGIDFFAT